MKLVGWRIGVAACLILGSCAAKESTRVVRRSPDDEVKEYVRLVVALGARDPDSLDYAYAPRDWTARDASEPPSFAVIRERALAAADRLDHLTAPPSSSPPPSLSPPSRSQPHVQSPVDPDEAERWRYLARHLRSVAVRAAILTGTRMSFDEESESLFGITLPHVDEAGAEQTYRELEGLLPGTGPLPARYARFQSRTLVPSARARTVFERALAGCHERTLQYLSLPPGERVEIRSVHDSPWSAFSRYLGAYHSAIQINLDFGLTVDRALSLACHEGYPGHHAQNSLAEARLVNDRGFLEFTVQPLFSPQALVAEGLAVQAVDLAFPGRERESFERDVLYPLAGLDGRHAHRGVEIERLVERLRFVSAQIARRYLDGDLEFVRAGSALRERALTPQPDALLRFLNEFRSYAVTYTYGPDWVRAGAGLDGDADAAARWRRYETAALQPWTLFSRARSRSPPNSLMRIVR